MFKYEPEKVFENSELRSQQIIDDNNKAESVWKT